MKESWFRRKKIKEVLTDQEKFLREIIEDYQNSWDTEKVFYVLNLQRRIKWILDETTPESPISTDHTCHFVKSGFYKRDGNRIQIEKCSICNRTQSVNKVRGGLGSKYVALICLKLEGVPMSIISQLLGVKKPTLEYHWSKMIHRKFSDLTVPTNYPINLRKKPSKIVADFSLDKQYKIRFWNNAMDVTITRVVNKSFYKNLLKIRIAQILLAQPHTPYLSLPTGIFGPFDFERIKELRKKTIGEVYSLPKIGRENIVITKLPQAQNKNEWDKIKIKFDFSAEHFIRYKLTTRLEELEF